VGEARPPGRDAYPSTYRLFDTCPAATIRWTYQTLVANRRVATVLSFIPVLGALADCMENTCLLAQSKLLLR